jgi:hypothetical protein
MPVLNLKPSDTSTMKEGDIEKREGLTDWIMYNTPYIKKLPICLGWTELLLPST